MNMDHDLILVLNIGPPKVRHLYEVARRPAIAKCLLCGLPYVRGMTLLERFSPEELHDRQLDGGAGICSPRAVTVLEVMAS